MTAKEELIDSITRHNPTAAPEFLVSFDEAALGLYLSHLKYLSNPRGGRAAWVRTSETRAVMSRTRMATA